MQTGQLSPSAASFPVDHSHLPDEAQALVLDGAPLTPTRLPAPLLGLDDPHVDAFVVTSIMGKSSSHLVILF